jgi:hypothetical protein
MTPSCVGIAHLAFYPADVNSTNYLLYQLWNAWNGLSVEDPHMIDRYLQTLTPSYLSQPRTSRHGAKRMVSESN